MPLVVRAFPLLCPIDELERFAEEVGDRGDEASAFYRKYGVSHESWHIQQTPNGPLVIVIGKFDDPAEAAQRYAASADEFDAWFKKQVLRLSGVDLDAAPLGPPTSPVFAWSDNRVPLSDLAM